MATATAGLNVEEIRKKPPRGWTTEERMFIFKWGRLPVLELKSPACNRDIALDRAADPNQQPADSFGSKMTFLERAAPMIELGIPVIPVEPKLKGTLLPDWPDQATTDPQQIERWNKENPDYNTGLAAELRPGAVCFLEWDVAGGMKAAALEMGAGIPRTRVHKSGKGFAHYVFRHTERSVKLGNRSANVDRREWFSFRAHRRYVVGPGSIHPNGNVYDTASDAEIADIPDWLVDWIDKHSRPEKASSSGALETNAYPIPS